MHIYTFYKHIQSGVVSWQRVSCKIEFSYYISLYLAIFKMSCCAFWAWGHWTFECKFRIYSTKSSNKATFYFGNCVLIARFFRVRWRINYSIIMCFISIVDYYGTAQCAFLLAIECNASGQCLADFYLFSSHIVLTIFNIFYITNSIFNIFYITDSISNIFLHYRFNL